MGLASETQGHKQDNFFLFFPMYVCLGVYYVLRALIAPILWIWNKSSDTLYNSVNKNIETNNLRGAYMTEEERIAAEKAASQALLDNRPIKKEVRVSESLIKARESLINSIDSGEEIRSDRPVTYRYTALSPDGKQVSNIFYAFSKVEVYTFLENEGYKVFKIETSDLIEKLYGSSSLFGKRKIKIKDIVFWLQQLSTYLKSGIPLTDSMRILSKQMGKNKNIKRTFDSIVYNLTLGESFSKSMEKQGDAFPSLLINMIKSAEATGDLEGTLDEMADYYKATETTRKEMISALTYPCLVIFFSIAVVIFILLYLIPQFVSIYEPILIRLSAKRSACSFFRSAMRFSALSYSSSFGARASLPARTASISATAASICSRFSSVVVSMFIRARILARSVSAFWTAAVSVLRLSVRLASFASSCASGSRSARACAMVSAAFAAAGAIAASALAFS